MRLIDDWLIYLADPLGPFRRAPRAALTTSSLRRLFLAAEMHGVLAAVVKNFAVANAGAADAAVLRQAEARHHAAVGFSLMLLQHGEAFMRLIGDLPAVMVKGPVFARRLYPERGLRSFTDIDILADADAIPALNAPFGELGFRVVEAQPSDDPQEWKWSHQARDEIIVEVHKNLVHAGSLRAAVSLAYRDIASDDMPAAAERASTLLVVAGVHGATHNFERLLQVSDILQAARRLTTPADESHLQQLLDRTGARFVVAAGVDLAGRLFRDKRCAALAREFRPVRYVAGARLLMGSAVVTSSMDRRRHAHSWRRALFRELIKRPQ